MKKLTKLLAKISLLFFLFTLINCQKDDSIIQEDTLVEINPIIPPEVNYYNNSTLPETISFQLKQSMRNMSTARNAEDLETSFGTILTDIVMKTTNDDGIENYTFRIEYDDDDPKTFYNLILRKNADSIFSEPYIKKYTMSNAFYSDYSSGISDINVFQGEFVNYSISEQININDLLNRSSNCPPEPIDNDVTDDPSDTGDGDSSGGGGTSGDGSTSDGGSNTGGSGIISCTVTLIVTQCSSNIHYTPPCDAEVFASAVLRTVCSDGSTSDTQLYRGGGDCPSDEGDVGVLDDDVPPCKKFQQLESNIDFKDKLQELKDNVNTDDFETGYKMNSSGVEQFDYEIREGESGKLGLDPGVGENEQIDGFIHNHINDSENRDISIFSPHDLYSLYKWLKNDNIQDRNSFVYIVTTSQGTTYALRIKSKSKFIAFGDSYLDGLQNGSNDFLPYIYKGRDKKNFPNGIKNNNGNLINERNFAKILYFGSSLEDTSKRTGLDLYKSDSNFENWKKVEYNAETDQISYDDC